MSETCRSRRGEGYEARDDEKQDKARRRLRLQAVTAGPQCGPLSGLLRARKGIPGTVWSVWQVSAFGVTFKPKNHFWCLLCPKASRFKGLTRRLFCYHRRFQGVTGRAGQIIQ